MKEKILTIWTILFAAILISSAFAQNPFQGVTSTVDGYPTWDSDMINIEAAGFTGKGVYIAVLDTGLTPNWRDYFPEERIATELGIGFKEDLFIADGVLYTTGVIHKTSFIGSTGTTHGTHVTSTIIGYFYDSPVDEYCGLDLPPIMVRGIAPEATIIPVKVLDTYYFPGYTGPDGVTFGTWGMVAAGIRYVTELKKAGYSPMIISMSIGGGPSPIVYEAIKEAIDAGVIVVAAAGNEGTEGMVWPGAYPEVISVGACGWRYEWWWPGDPDGPDSPKYEEGSRYRLWWLQQEILYGYNDIPEESEELVGEVYITDWSSRELAGQDLDVVAPGSWVRGPYPGMPGYAHLPWWSERMGWIVSPVMPGNFYYVGGTSMATPHVSSIAALMLEKNPTLGQADVESILELTALDIPPGSMTVYDYGPDGWGWYTYEWELETPDPYEATGAGLVQADAAIEKVTPP